MRRGSKEGWSRPIRGTRDQRSLTKSEVHQQQVEQARAGACLVREVGPSRCNARELNIMTAEQTDTEKHTEIFYFDAILRTCVPFHRNDRTAKSCLPVY